jgi:hypothetical protein
VNNREFRSSIVTGIGSIFILCFAIFLPLATTTEALGVKAFIDSIISFAVQFVPDEFLQSIAVFVILLAFALTVLLPFATKKMR